MAEAVRVEIKGLDKLRDYASRFPKIAQTHIDKAIVRSIGEIDIKTKPLTPVKTARLKGSLIPIFRPFQGVYGSSVAYARAIHDKLPEGTPFKRPSLNKRAVAGFLSVGVKQATTLINEQFKQALDNIVKEVNK